MVSLFQPHLISDKFDSIIEHHYGFVMGAVRDLTSASAWPEDAVAHRLFFRLAIFLKAIWEEIIRAQS